MKKAIFIVCYYGYEGLSKESIVFASYSEEERNNWNDNHPNKDWYTCKDLVADLDEVAEKAWKKLDGLERLSLLQTSCLIWQKDYDAFD